MFTLKDRTMVITGGAGNNGMAIVNAALENGMNVALLSGMHTKAQKAIQEKIPDEYRSRVIGLAQNPKAKWNDNMAAAPEIYSENEHMSDIIRYVYDYFGSVDVVVNAKGGHIRYDFEHTDKEIWRHSMEVVESAFVNAKNAYQYLLKSKAPRIINITTSDARNGGYFMDPSFAAARGGLEALTYELARELGPQGITSNCILIGHCEGDVPAEDTLSEQEREIMKSRIPVGRMMEPKDLVGAFCFLASEEASFVNGARIDVNGVLFVG